MEKRKNSESIDVRNSKRRKMGFTGRAEEGKSSPSPEEISEQCRKMLQDITFSEDFALLCRLTKGEFMNFSLIEYRINAGIYGKSPELFNSDLQKMLSRVNELGQKMIHDADELSHISQASFEKHVGGFLNQQVEENIVNESGQMLNRSDKGNENEEKSPSLHETEGSSDSQQMSSDRRNDREDTLQEEGIFKECARMEDLQPTDEENYENESQHMCTKSLKSQENERQSASFDEAEDSSDSQEEKESWEGKSFARKRKSTRPSHSSDSQEEKDSWEGKSFARKRKPTRPSHSSDSQEEKESWEGKSFARKRKPIRPSHSSDSRQMSIDSPSDQENDAENSSEEGESSEYLSLDPQTGYPKSYARKKPRAPSQRIQAPGTEGNASEEETGSQSVEMHTDTGPQNSSEQKGKSYAGHKNPRTPSHEIQSSGSKGNASKEQDKSISHGNTSLHMTSKGPNLRSNKNQSYNRQQNDHKTTSGEPIMSKTTDKRNQTLKMHGDEIQSYKEQQIDEESVSEDQENDAESTSQGGDSSEHESMDLQTRYGKSYARHKKPTKLSHGIQSSGIKGNVKKEQDKSGNTCVHITSKRSILRSNMNQSYNRQQDDQDNTSGEPKNLEILDKRNQTLKMHGDEIQSYKEQQIDEQTSSGEQENSGASYESPELHGDNQGPVREKKCCKCETGIKDKQPFIECSNEKCTFKFFHLSCLNPPLMAAPPPGSVWFCPSCLCRVCSIDVNEEKIIMCSDCKECYHLYCLNPPLPGFPKKRWFCSPCLEKQKTLGNSASGSKVNSRKKPQLLMAGEGSSKQSRKENVAP